VVTISAHQLRVLSEARRVEFLGRVRRVIESHFPMRPSEAALHALYRRGLEHGVRNERELAAYIVVSAAVGALPPKSDPLWIVDAIEECRDGADNLVDRLFDDAEAIADRK